MYRKFVRSIWLILLLILGLSACAPSPGAPASALPLAADRPTFLLFYTDN
jgi:hypothetical protein